MDKNLRAFIAELIGTFALVFLSAGTVCAAYLPRGEALDVTGIALAQGLILAVLLSATVHVSGGYLNPAITIMLWVLRRLDNLPAIVLLVAQLLGAAVAGGCLRAIFSDSVLVPAHFGTPHLSEAFTDLSFGSLATGAGIEVVLTFILAFVIFGTMIDPRAPRMGGLGVGLTVGLALAAIALMGFRLTGASVNPARSFGPLVWELSYAWGTEQVPSLREQVLVYWIGPIVGALLAGLIYTYLILPPEGKKD
jgi:aquaporin TIP